MSFATLDPARRALAEQKAREYIANVRDNAPGVLLRIQGERRRRAWAQDPDLWARERLGSHLWSRQREIAYSVRDNRKTAVMSCHGPGKSYVGGRIVAWWLDIHKAGDAFVVTSAPTAPQVEAILWKEIGRAHGAGQLAGRVNQTEWYMQNVYGKEELVAFGRKPSDYNPTAFQGIHGRYVLVLFDEAVGMPYPLWEAADTLISNDYSKFLAIGNPDDPRSEFASVCKPGSGWNVISISAFDTPNLTGEKVPSEVAEVLVGRLYIEEKRKRWAPGWRWNDANTKCEPPPGVDPTQTNPLWQSKVLGRFPHEVDHGGLIPISWIVQAQHRELEATVPVELGHDVGGGGDANATCVRRGYVFRIIRENHEPDTMKQCGMLVEDMKEVNATLVKVDKIGIGWGVVNRGQELKLPFVGINVGESATDTVEGTEEDANDDRFENLKAELYWGVRELFERGLVDIDPLDDDLAGQLAGIRYERTSKGRIKISDKRKDARGHPIPSPNRAEAFMLAASNPPQRELEYEPTWGR